MAIEERASVCTFDCPDTCSLTVSVEEGRIVKVRGSDAAPYTAGVICNKVARDMGDFVHGPRRLLHPLRRIGPKGSEQFERISWDSALDEIHERVSDIIARSGPESVMPLNYAGPHGFLAGASMSSRFFNRLGATQLYRRALCGGVRSEAWAGTYGAVPGCPPEFAEHAKLNVVWGNNATVSNLHLVRCIRKAKRAGGKLVVVDPLRTKIAEQADLHLQLLPGTDTLLAWSVAAELERLGSLDDAFIAANVLGAEEFMTLARQWPAARAAVTCGLRESQILTFTRWLAEAELLVLAPQRARTGPQWRKRHQSCDRSAGAARQAGQGQRHRPRCEQRLSQDPGQAAAAGSGSRGDPHAQHQRYRPASCRGRHRPAAARAVHLQPQSDRRAPRPEPNAPRARPSRRVCRRH